jgi:glycosyltransferase involved in cell wall biosynthesis
MPFFSIVIPTRNRSSLLRTALKTAIEQKFDDFEVLVCDNNSKDETRDVVKTFMDQSSKVRYVNPEHNLSMCDNWEFALNETRGEYVTYLSDDDALLLDTLPLTHSLITKFGIDLLVWPDSFYQHPDIPESNTASLSCDFTTGRFFEVASDPIIEGLFKFQRIASVIPRMLNGAVRKSLVTETARKTGKFFVPPYPDYSTACQLLSTTNSYHFLDVALSVTGASVLSNSGLRFGRKQKIDEYQSLYDGDALAGIPYPMRYLTSPYFLATYENFKKLYPTRFRYDADLEAYLNSMFSELVWYEDHDDVSDEFEQLKGYMRDFSGSDEMFDNLRREHDRAKAGLSGLRALGAQAKNKLRNSAPLFNLAKAVKNYVAPAQPAYIEFSGVPSIYDAALLLGTKQPMLDQPADAFRLEHTTSPLFLQEARSVRPHW